MLSLVIWESDTPLCIKYTLLYCSEFAIVLKNQVVAFCLVRTVICSDVKLLILNRTYSKKI